MALSSRPALLCTRLACRSQVPLAIRSFATTTTTTTITAPTPTPPNNRKSKRPLTQKENDFLDRALRVNQAGELGANLIYEGQYAVFKSDPRLRPLIRHMWDQEIHHLQTFDKLIERHRVRPTAMRPIWNVAGYALGLGTALLGEKAAMACTEAVETEIGGHYNNQLRELLQMIKENPELGEEGSDIAELVKTIREFRDDELEHLDTAVAHDAKGAAGYEVLHNLIRGGCKAAIYISERV
ncbi:ubiquinone biosynthesis protein COQ7-domain-containing protein [Geopyxis carbonaria]|nr:ubiquinone biosynthesis protein COQ7-domain-containing protein [Geopyxis carbonaria]